MHFSTCIEVAFLFGRGKLPCVIPQMDNSTKRKEKKNPNPALLQDLLQAYYREKKSNSSTSGQFSPASSGKWVMGIKMNPEPSRPGENPATASATRTLFQNLRGEQWKEPLPPGGDGPDGKMAPRKGRLGLGRCLRTAQIYFQQASFPKQKEKKLFQ